jgi:hypothetical protein
MRMGYHYHLTPALRLVRVIALSLLLVGVQYGALLHALEHDGEALRHAQGQTFSVPDDEVCAICVLFAGGANAVASDAACAALALGAEAKPQFAPTSIAASTPSWYSSRAPPVSL